MAVKTQLSSDDFAAILASYALGDYRDAQPLPGGAVQTNFRVQTTQGDFVLKYYESRPAGWVRFEANLVDYLRRGNYPCAAIFRNRQGRAVSFYRSKPVVIFEFVEGHHVERPNPRQRRRIVQAAATLQIITRHYRPRLKSSRWNYSRELCLQLARAEADRLGTGDAYAKARWFERELATLALPPSLPTGICHCDYDYSNTLFRGDALVALLDFDDANYTYLTFDLVNLIDNWAWPHEGEFDSNMARQIAGDYGRTRSLSALEKRHVLDVHKLQILFDGIWFFARGRADDFYEKGKIEHLDSLGRDGYTRALFE